MVIVRFMSVTGKFREVRRASFKTSTQALLAVEAEYAPLGYSKFQLRDDGEFDSQRITATTPGGRGGRNVAFCDWECEGPEGEYEDHR